MFSFLELSCPSTWCLNEKYYFLISCWFQFLSREIQQNVFNFFFQDTFVSFICIKSNNIYLEILKKLSYYLITCTFNYIKYMCYYIHYIPYMYITCMCYLKKVDKDFFNVNNICSTIHGSTNHWCYLIKYILLKRLFRVPIKCKKNFHWHNERKYGNSNKKHCRKNLWQKKTW